MTYPTLFDEKRTAQAAAFLLHRAGGRLPVLKLMKLMYLAERESLKRYGEPISGDKLVSMPQGPVLSNTLNLMNGAADEAVRGGWADWIEGRAGYDVALRDPSMIRTPEQDLLELSTGDLNVLGDTWAAFGHMEKFELVHYTHTQGCPEWEDPHGSSRPIPMGRLFRELGYSDEGVRSAVTHLNEQAILNSTLR